MEILPCLRVNTKELLYRICLMLWTLFVGYGNMSVVGCITDVSESRLASTFALKEDEMSAIQFRSTR
jgi:hypothetical protein